MSCELFDRYSIWFGGFLMVQKVGEINQMNPLLFCLQKLWKTGLFHQSFEPLKIHQTISNSNQTIHKTLYLMKIDKSGPKNNYFWSLIWKGSSGVLTTIFVGFRYFLKLSRYLYHHKAIKFAQQSTSKKCDGFQGCVAILFSWPMFLIFPS